MTQFEDVLETILEEYARRDSEGEFDTWEETDAFVKKKAEVLLAYVKEDPVSSIWHDASEPPIIDKTFLLIAPNGNSSLCLWGGKQLHSATIGGGHSILCKGDIYSYIDDLLNLYNSCNFGKNLQEEPVSEDLEKIVEEIAEPTILNAYGTKELARRLRNTICGTSISENLEEAMQHNAPDNIGIDDLLYWRNGFIAGAKWQKEQMMANAVEGVVHHFEKCKVASVHYNDPTGVPMAYFTSPEGLSAGNKVKIIVIKEG